jgi:hypothetical protein
MVPGELLSNEKIWLLAVKPTIGSAPTGPEPATSARETTTAHAIPLMYAKQDSPHYAWPRTLGRAVGRVTPPAGGPRRAASARHISPTVYATRRPAPHARNERVLGGQFWHASDSEGTDACTDRRFPTAAKGCKTPVEWRP